MDIQKNHVFFENTMAEAFAEGRRVLRDDVIACIVCSPTI